MTHQPNRLAAAAHSHKFAGTEIDRSSPLAFRLNGRLVEGFAGDTVLSAVLASGIDAVGMRGGEPIGLSECFAPAVIPAGSTNAAAALPMQRMPALPDLDLVTLGSLGERIAAAVAPLARLRHLLFGPGRSLNLRLDDPGTLAGSWRELQPQSRLDADVVIVGGGVAGMSAAAAAAAAGEVAVLIERRPMLGGAARFFGAVESEEPPDAAIARLSAQLAQMPGVTVLTRTEAHGIAGTIVFAHQVEVDGRRAAGRALRIEARRIVLATGAFERLPVFPGNRTAGIGGGLAAFQLADGYGVWPGKRALFHTTHNFSYRLALLAHDAGIRVERITDARVDPQSRFIDFCKASGITLAGGLVPMEAAPARSGLSGVAVRFAVAIEGIALEAPPIHADRFIVAGGWQPELSLWLMAGGKCRWNARTGWLEAEGSCENVVLAGAAAGFRNNSACMHSGRSAIAGLLGRPATVIDDRQIEAIYETPDGSMPACAKREAGRTRAYLGAGFGLAERRVAHRRREPMSALAAHPLAFDLDEVAAAVQLGDVPEADAGVVASERCLGRRTIVDSGWRLPVPAEEPSEAMAPPAYLTGRFGPRPQLATVGAGDGRFFEPGCLIFLSSDQTDPGKAVGVIVGPAPGGCSGGLAMIGKVPGGIGTRLFVRDSSGPVPVELLDRPKAEV